MRYETINFAMTPACVDAVATALALAPTNLYPASVQVELQNFHNELQNRLQHVIADARAARQAPPDEEDLLA